MVVSEKHKDDLGQSQVHVRDGIVVSMGRSSQPYGQTTCHLSRKVETKWW